MFPHWQNEYKVQMEAIRKAEDLSAHDRAVKIMNLGPKKKPLLRVIVGTAGCGKSFLINAIADELTVQYTTPETRASQPAVLLAAPTGLAAVQIRGSTLHSLLGIEVQHGQDQAMRPLSGMRLNQLRLQVNISRTSQFRGAYIGKATGNHITVATDAKCPSSHCR